MNPRDFQDYSAIDGIRDALAAEGLTFGGYSVVPAGAFPADLFVNGEPLRIVVNFTPEATPTQRARVAEIIAAADKRPRTKKTQAEQIADLDKLSKADKDKAILAIIAKQLEVEPRFLQRIGITYKGDKDPAGQIQGQGK